MTTTITAPRLAMLFSGNDNGEGYDVAVDYELPDASSPAQLDIYDADENDGLTRTPLVVTIVRGTGRVTAVDYPELAGWSVPIGESRTCWVKLTCADGQTTMAAATLNGPRIDPAVLDRVRTELEFYERKKYVAASIDIADLKALLAAVGGAP